ncbi:MAG: bacteriohemerythrin [Candidatus Auribacterota bacterium]|jgi:hemerythrin|nr:bacteriohemerythrin [Candidatus Auribacterota bacterium]
MALIEWNQSYSVNVCEIDEQHKKLIALLNELYDAMKAGKSKDVLTKTLKGLIDYTVYHFGAEEKYMHKFNYPGYLSHKGEHEKLVRKVVDFQKEFEKGNASISIDLMNFLKDWVSGHIQGTDKKYSSFFNQNGLK